MRIFLPFYPVWPATTTRYVPVDFIRDVPVQLGPHRFTYTARTALLPDSEVSVYFIDCPALFGRGGIYHGDRDDSLRFGLLTVAAFESRAADGLVARHPALPRLAHRRWRRSTARPSSTGTACSSARGRC